MWYNSKTFRISSDNDLVMFVHWWAKIQGGKYNLVNLKPNQYASGLQFPVCEYRSTDILCFYVHACISVCASKHVCILFMARNQLSLAHNGNVNSPERLSPTQGEIWLGAGCIFPTPNSEKELAGLKLCPLLCSSPEGFTALPIHYSNRSSKQV